MKFVLLVGSQAVGKMTVGQELEKITHLKLFHNHMSIEMVAPFFSYGTKEGKRLVGLFREEIFKAVAKSDLEGLMFTFVWAFDMQEDWDYVEEVCDIFRKEGGEIYIVELIADIEERRKRNTDPHRLSHKPTKRDVEWSDKELIDTMEQYRLVSDEGEIKEKNYLRINNTNISPEKAAQLIKETFAL